MDGERVPPDDADGGAPRAEEPSVGMPRWAKVFLVVVAAVALLIVAILLLGGEHGPGRHSGAPGEGGPMVIAARIAVTGGA
jgi:hypothetical protein